MSINNISKAYLRHLTIAKERLAAQIASIHNLAFYLWLVKEARGHIIYGDFKDWKKQILIKLTKKFTQVHNFTQLKL